VGPVIEMQCDPGNRRTAQFWHGVVAATDRGSAKKRATASNAQREKAGFGGRRRRRSADARPVSAAKWTARCKRSLLVVRPVRHHHLGCCSVEPCPSGRAWSTATSRSARPPRPGSRGTRSIAGAAAMQPLRFSWPRPQADTARPVWDRHRGREPGPQTPRKPRFVIPFRSDHPASPFAATRFL